MARMRWIRSLTPPRPSLTTLGRILTTSVLVVLVALALAALLSLALALWRRTDDQLADVIAARTAVADTTQLEPKERLGLEKDLIQAQTAIGSARGQLFGSLAQLA